MHPDPAWPFLSAPSHPVLSAIWAVFIHSLLAVIVIAPIIWRRPNWLLWAALAAFASVALDLDHVVAAGSLDPRNLEHLRIRPDTHSLLFACVLSLVGFAISRSWVVAWGVFAVLVSHLLFDAAGGSERWLYPLQSPTAIPWLACPVGICVLTGVSVAVARAGSFNRASSASIIAKREPT